MFYTMMQQYYYQQLQQLQTFQYQQSQYLDWHYRQLQAWQNAMLNSLLFKQMPWFSTLFPNSTAWVTGFAPFSWPFMQYTLQMTRQPATAKSGTTVNIPTHQMRELEAQFNSLQQAFDAKLAQSIQPTFSTTGQSETSDRQSDAKTVNNTTSNTESKVASKVTSQATSKEKSQQPASDTSAKIVVPSALLTQPPKQTDVAPPQADIPQPKHEERATPSNDTPLTQMSSQQLIDAATDAATKLLTNAATGTASRPQAQAATTSPAQAKTTANTHTKTTNEPANSKLSDAEKVLRQMQREETDLPAPAKLAKVEPAIITPTSTTLLSTLSSIEPVSAIEQVRQAVDVIDLNQATEAQLLKLAGINRRIAKEIINYRNQHKVINNIAELTSIKGVGQATLNKIRHCLVVNTTDDIATTGSADAVKAELDKIQPSAPTAMKQ